MNLRLFSRAAFLASLTVVPAMAAQNSDATHAPDFRAQETIAPLYFPARANAPFSAVVYTTVIRTLPDGSTVTHQNSRVVARAMDGRVYQDRRMFVPLPNPENRQSTPYASQYDDPVGQVTYRCIIAAKTCDAFPLQPRPEQELPVGLQPGKSSYLTRENLGIENFKGLDVVHTRETLTFYRAGIGNTNAILRSVEYWYSPALDVNLKVVRHDPRDGDQTLWLDQIVRSAPEEKWFTLPPDFRIIDHRKPQPRN